MITNRTETKYIRCINRDKKNKVIPIIPAKKYQLGNPSLFNTNIKNTAF